MSPQSKKQKTTACMVLAMRDGKLSKDKFPRVSSMMKDMSTEELRKFCHGEIEKS